MKKYCKAYYAHQIKQFSGWSEGYRHPEQDLDDNDVIYLWDDFTVVRSPIASSTEQVLFDDVTPQWQQFCREILQFNIPQDLRYAYTPAESSQ
ncbi:MAG TPA: hypothetical protein VFN23_18780 [Ktedonobacteraceae bacterium]|nr:hypothetical protein [Ktedonobacteraceae bacterium]